MKLLELKSKKKSFFLVCKRIQLKNWLCGVTGTTSELSVVTLDGLWIGNDVFQVVDGAGLALLLTYAGTYESSSLSIIVFRLACGGLITNIQFSTTDTGDDTFWNTAKGDLGNDGLFVGWGRELRSDKGETSINTPAPRSRESNGRLGVIDDWSSSLLFSN